MNLARTLPRLEVPIVMVQGRHDQVALADSDGTQAPCRHRASAWCSFRDSRRARHIWRNGKFRDLLIRNLMPATRQST